MTFPIEYESILGQVVDARPDGFSLRLPSPGEFEHYTHDMSELNANVDDIVFVSRRRNRALNHYPEIETAFVLHHAG